MGELKTSAAGRVIVTPQHPPSSPRPSPLLAPTLPGLFGSLGKHIPLASVKAQAKCPRPTLVRRQRFAAGFKGAFNVRAELLVFVGTTLIIRDPASNSRAVSKSVYFLGCLIRLTQVPVVATTRVRNLVPSTPFPLLALPHSSGVLHESVFRHF